MSVKLIDWALDQQLPPFHRFVLLILADHCGADATCYPSIRHIGRRTGISERTIQRCLRDLERGNVITHFQTPKKQWMFRVNHGLPMTLPGRELRGKGAPKQLREEAIVVFGKVCFWCEKAGDGKLGPDGRPWSLDRLHLGKFGGKYSPENVVLSCLTCNLDRRTKTPEEFAAAIGKDLTSFKGVEGWGASAGHRGGDDESPGGRQPATGGASERRLHLNRQIEPSVQPEELFALNGALPPPLNRPDIEDAWKTFLDNLVQKRRKPTDLSKKLQIRKMLEMGPARALAALKHSASNNFIGLYEPGGHRPAESPTRSGKITRDNAL